LLWREPMGRRKNLVVIAFLAAGLSLPACAGTGPEEEGESAAEVQVIEGSEQARVILSAEALDRVGIETAAVRTAGPERGGLVIPYAAVLYDPAGKTWTYTNPEPRVYVRKPIQIAEISGDLAYLSSGPAAGTLVVTVGASELLGTEYEVGEE
jgi:hypothetical protein